MAYEDWRHLLSDPDADGWCLLLPSMDAKAAELRHADCRTLWRAGYLEFPPLGKALAVRLRGGRKWGQVPYLLTLAQAATTWRNKG